jgi:serine/threonine protein kinase
MQSAVAPKEWHRVAGYAIFECIGKGSFGHVFRAVNLLSDEKVAVKFVSHAKLGRGSTAYKWLEGEIFALQVTANHPHTSGVRQVRISILI